METIADKMRFSPLEDHFFDEVRLSAIFSEENKVEEAYKIEKIDKKEQRDILFLRSCMSDFLRL